MARKNDTSNPNAQFVGLPQRVSYYAEYWSVDPARFMLGGVKRSKSSRFSHEADALLRLQSAIDVHATLDNPLTVEGHIRMSFKQAEIKRHCEGAEAQAIGAICPKCRMEVR